MSGEYLSSLLALQPCVSLGHHHGFVVVNFSGRTKDYTSFGPYLLTSLALVALPRAYIPASLALHVIVVCRPLLHNKTVELKEGKYSYSVILL
jgi:hypothetical protein